MDLGELSTTPVKLPDGSDSTLLEALDSWADYVLKVADGIPTTPGDPELAGIRKFVAGLFIRDGLEKGLAGLSAPAIVRAVDALYAASTLKDDHSVLSKLDDSLPTEPWWWGRIPGSGALAAEFSRQARMLR